MTAPRAEIVIKEYQNPHASAPLRIPILVLCNTSDEDLERNIRANAARDLPWVGAVPAHDRRAIMVGGGPSAVNDIEFIRYLQRLGGAIFAINGASRWLGNHGIIPDYQVIADAKPETASLVDPDAADHLIASQVNEATLNAAPLPKLWHLGGEQLEAFFPEDRKKRGGYVLLGGGAATGNSALCLAYAMGYRSMHIFGYDSCNRGGASHAYDQPMNRFIPTVDVTFAGRTFTASVAMKAQAEKFQMTAQALKQEGCELHLYGDGLLQHMYRSPPENLSERDKYRLMWQFDTYREISPGEECTGAFALIAQPDGLILDLGCGTGRAGLRLAEMGHDVLLIDFADNCRDDEALGLPFLEWDLSRPLPPRAPYGFCADVMEHIPLEQCDTVLANMFEAAQRIFFRIDTKEDACGAIIHSTLHLNVQSHEWWRDRLSAYGAIAHEQCGEDFSVFYVTKEVANDL